MKFVSPVVPGADLPEIQLASNQPEFETLPVVHCGFGVMLCRAEFTDDEIAEIVKTRSVYLFQVTGGKAPNPIILDVWTPKIAPDTGAPAPPPDGYLVAPMVVEVMLVGAPNDTPEESLAMLRALLKRFSPPFRLVGYSLKVTYDRITPIHPTTAAAEYPDLFGVFGVFQAFIGALIEREGLPIEVGSFCALVAAGRETFLLDANLFFKAQSAAGAGTEPFGGSNGNGAGRHE
jgi:hypothetical protein